MHKLNTGQSINRSINQSSEKFPRRPKLQTKLLLSIRNSYEIFGPKN